MGESIGQGNVVQSFTIGNTRVKICDDYCRGKTPEQVREEIERMTGRVQEAFSVFITL